MLRPNLRSLWPETFVARELAVARAERTAESSTRQIPARGGRLVLRAAADSANNAEATDATKEALRDLSAADAAAACNHRGPRAITPLMLAARSGFENCCKLLIEHGADADAQSESGVNASESAQCAERRKAGVPRAVPRRSEDAAMPFRAAAPLRRRRRRPRAVRPRAALRPPRRRAHPPPRQHLERARVERATTAEPRPRLRLARSCALLLAEDGRILPKLPPRGRALSRGRCRPRCPPSCMWTRA